MASQAWVIGQVVLNPVLVAGAGPAAINAVSTVEYLSMLFVSVLIAVEVNPVAQGAFVHAEFPRNLNDRP